jgi:hypothetical protein
MTPLVIAIHQMIRMRNASHVELPRNVYDALVVDTGMDPPVIADVTIVNSPTGIWKIREAPLYNSGMPPKEWQSVSASDLTPPSK